MPSTLTDSSTRPTAKPGSKLNCLAALAVCCTLPFQSAAAVATWNGEAQNADWADPLNWDAQVAPTTGDDVTASGGPVDMRINIAATVKSISLPPGSTLTVYDPAGSLLVTGSARLDGVNLSVAGGARLNLPGLANFSAQVLTNAGVSWNCSGPGSVLSVSGLAKFIGSPFPWRTDINASDTGKIALGGNFEVPGGAVAIIGTGIGTEIELPGLRRLAPNYVDLWAREGAKVTVTNLLEFNGTDPDRGSLYLESTGTNSLLQISGLTNFVGSRYPSYAVLVVRDGGRLAVNGSFGASAGVYLAADGPNSVLEAPGLKRLAPDYFTCNVQGGAQLLLPALREWFGAGASHEGAFWTSAGTNSLIDLPALTNVIGSPYPFVTRFVAGNGGKVSLGGDFSVPGGGLHLASDGANALLEAPGLKRLQPSALSLEASNGGRLSLSHLREFSASQLQWADLRVTSSGTNSLLEWGELALLRGSEGVWGTAFAAITGGKLIVRGEYDVRAGTVSFTAVGTGAEIQLPGLRHLAPDEGSLGARDGGRVSVLNLLEFSGANAETGTALESFGANSVVEVAGLTNVVGCPFPRQCFLNVNQGGRLTLKGDFGVSAGGVYLAAVGARSVLEASGLKRLAPDYFTCSVQNGAQLLLPALLQWAGASVIHESAYWTCMGTNSLLDLPALAKFSGSPYPFVTRIAAQDGGTVQLGGDFEILEGGINLAAEGAGSQLQAPGLKRLQPSSFNLDAEAGGQISLPHLREFSGASNAWGSPTWASRGSGSSVFVSELAKFEGSAPPWDTGIVAATGGRLSINGQFNINYGGFAFYSIGAGSLLEIPGLAILAPKSLGISIDGGGRFLLPGLREVSNSNAQGTFNWSLIGTNSTLEMPALATLQVPPAPWGLFILAQSGAKARLPAVPVIEGGYAIFRADGAGAVIDLRGLGRFDTYPRGGQLFAVNGGEIMLAPVFGFRGVSVEGLSSWGLPLITNGFSSTEVLCAQPGLAARVEIRPTGLGAAPWRNFGRVAVLTNQVSLYNTFSVPPGFELRVTELRADPPEVGLNRAPDGRVRLTLFGLPGKSYRLDGSPGIGPAVWTKVGDATLSHPFGQIDFPPSGALGYFRAVSQ